MRKRHLAHVLVGALITITPFTATIDARADSYDIGANGNEPRCQNALYAVCLYYGSSTSTAYWPTDKSRSDLAGQHFRANTGTGSGASVKQNSMAMYCNTTQCNSFTGINYGGNFDYEFKHQVGRLHYTSNNNSSLYLGSVNHD